MLFLLEYLIYGHIHKWETIEVSTLTDADSGSVGTRYNLRCIKCGNIKMVDLIK